MRSVQRANLDRSGVEELITGLPVPANITLDIQRGKMYWTTWSVHTMQSADLDGADVEDVLVNAGSWGTGIRSGNLDGTQTKTLIRGSQPVGVAVHVEPGRIYWTAMGSGKVRRASLDGSAVEDVVVRAGAPGYIALDVYAGKMYWTGWEGDTTQRANLDGTAVEDVVAGLRFPSGLALDLTLPAQEATLDLSRESRRTIQAGLVTLDTSNGHLYWTTTRGNIRRSKLDRSEVEDFLMFASARGIAVDVKGGHLYWTTRRPDGIRRSNLDGTDMRDIVVFGTNAVPRGIALDVDGGKMYWTERSTGKIRRADLSGANVEDVIAGLADPVGIALDVGGGRMYWTNGRGDG